MKAELKLSCTSWASVIYRDAASEKFIPGSQPYDRWSHRRGQTSANAAGAWLQPHDQQLLFSLLSWLSYLREPDILGGQIVQLHVYIAGMKNLGIIYCHYCKKIDSWRVKIPINSLEMTPSPSFFSLFFFLLLLLSASIRTILGTELVYILSVKIIKLIFGRLSKQLEMQTDDFINVQRPKSFSFFAAAGGA